MRSKSLVYVIVLFLFSLARATLVPLEGSLSGIQGLIIILETENEITDELIALRDEYKDFVIKELENPIGKEYDHLIVGFSIKFTNLTPIYYRVGSFLDLKEITLDDDKTIYKGLYDLLINFKKEELHALGASLLMQPDSNVQIFQST